MTNLKYLPKRLQDWFENNGETIELIGRIRNQLIFQIKTNKNIYHWDFQKDVLYVRYNNEFEKVLYPNRAIETSLWE